MTMSNATNTRPADERIAGTHRGWRSTIVEGGTLASQNFGPLRITEAATILFKMDGVFFCDYPGGVARCEVLPCGDMVISHDVESDEEEGA